jgi:hypothetical protein
MRDFWISSGHHLLDRDADGRLLLTDAFLKAYLARPELLPPDSACEAELRLHHELLMHHPRRPVAATPCSPTMVIFSNSAKGACLPSSGVISARR